ncbi:hypothetical protein GCM10023096_51200 [Nonomuraea ferruginea]
MQLGDQGTHDGSLLLQRVHVAEQDVQGQGTHIHRWQPPLALVSSARRAGAAETGPDARKAPGGWPAGRPATDQARGFSRISNVSMTSSILMSL